MLCCTRWIPWFTLILTLSGISHNAFAQKKYDPGASDAEIRIGQTLP